MGGFLVSPSRILYLVEVAWLRIGVGRDTQTLEEYPDIELYYPPGELPEVKKILEEMQLRKVFPQIYILDSDGPSYVVVLFRLKAVDRESMGRLFPTAKWPAKLRTGPDLIMTGEAELPWGQTKPFHDLYAKQGHFKLFVLDEQEKPLYGVQLSKFETSWPDDLLPR